VDLGLIALLVFVGPAAEEDAAVEMLAVADALQLEYEIAPLLLGLQVARAVLDFKPAFRGDAEPGLLAGMLLPACEVLAVEQGPGCR